MEKKFKDLVMKNGDTVAEHRARPSWDQYFLDMARLVATRATCPVRQVGAVFVDRDSHGVLSMGYNGSPRGTKHCGEACLNREHGSRTDECRAVHSETNAILNAARQGIRLEGSKVYITLSPCHRCAANLIQVGVAEIIYEEDSAYPDVFNELKGAGISVRQVHRKLT